MSGLPSKDVSLLHPENRKKLTKCVLEQGKDAQDVGQISTVVFIGPCSTIQASIKEWKGAQRKCTVLPWWPKEQTRWNVLWLLIKQDAVSLGGVMLDKIWIHLNVKRAFTAPMGLGLVEQATANWPVESGWAAICHHVAVWIRLRIHKCKRGANKLKYWSLTAIIELKLC